MQRRQGTKQLEAVVVDPASDWPLFAEKARELLTVENVDIMFDVDQCFEKVVLPVIEEFNGSFYLCTMKVKKVQERFTRALHRTSKRYLLQITLEELGVEKFALPVQIMYQEQQTIY